VRGEVEPEPAPGLERLRQRFDGAQVEDADRPDVDGQALRLASQNMLRQRASEAIPGADDDDPEPVGGFHGLPRA
jgi:hypothetical protein